MALVQIDFVQEVTFLVCPHKLLYSSNTGGLVNNYESYNVLSLNIKLTEGLG